MSRLSFEDVVDSMKQGDFIMIPPIPLSVKKEVLVAVAWASVILIVGGFIAFLIFSNHSLQKQVKDTREHNAELVLINQKNTEVFDRQMNQARASAVIARKERDQAIKREQSYGTIRQHIDAAEPSDRASPVSPVITHTIDKIYEEKVR